MELWKKSERAHIQNDEKARKTQLPFNMHMVPHRKRRTKVTLMNGNTRFYNKIYKHLGQQQCGAQRVGGQQNDRIYMYVNCFKLASSVFFIIDTHCPKCQWNTVSWNVSCAFVELHWTSMCLDILISRSILKTCRSNVKSTLRHMRSCKT